jgi:hypothetical protein
VKRPERLALPELLRVTIAIAVNAMLPAAAREVAKPDRAAGRGAEGIAVLQPALIMLAAPVA